MKKYNINHQQKFTIAIIATAMLTLAGCNTSQSANQNAQERQTMTAQSDTQTSQLTASEKAGLEHMIAEERLAHDVYVTLGERWNIPVFDRIASTEVRHHDAVQKLATAYGIAMPAELPLGQFADAEIQALYDKLIAQGMQSEIDALQVGAYIEDLDIYDLMTLVEQTDKADVKATYDWLTMGSRNHMRGFYRALNERGASYTPTHISNDLYHSIITTPNERGGGRGMGYGKCEQGEGRQGEGRQGEGRQGEGRQGEGRQGEGRQGRHGAGRQGSEGQQGHRNREGLPPMLESLNLTEAQRTQMEIIWQARTNNEEGSESEVDHRAQHQKMKQAIDQVLTTEQQEQLEMMRAEGRGSRGIMK